MNRALARAVIFAARRTDAQARWCRSARRCFVQGPLRVAGRRTSWAINTEATVPVFSGVALVWASGIAALPDVPPPELLSTTVAISQGVLAPVPALPFGVAP